MDQLAPIEPVDQHPVVPGSIAVNGRGAPCAATRSGYAIGVEAERDRASVRSVRIFGEDPPDDHRLIGIYLAQAANHLAALVEAVGAAVAKGEAGGRASLRDHAALGALDVERQILALLRVEEAFDPALDVVDLAVGEREQPDLGASELLADRIGVALVPRYAAGRLGQNLIDAAGGGARQHGVEAGPLADAGRAADRIVRIDVNDLPAFRMRALTANADLVLNRPGVLKVAAKAGVNQGAHANRLSRFARERRGARRRAQAPWQVRPERDRACGS
ncbi:hypothetical protein WP12_16890 [Sphingomonas sp. SRS2]|nr:hypothetical protein WP12_16890 [Sphingomonas sp. SRS2]